MLFPADMARQQIFEPANATIAALIFIQFRGGLADISCLMALCRLPIFIAGPRRDAILLLGFAYHRS